MRLSALLTMPNAAHLLDQVCLNAPWALTVADAGSRAGQRVVICGAGPSLAEEADRLPAADEVWACNSALPYLMDRGVPVTHGVTIDHGAAMLEPGEFGRDFPVGYYLASSVHPELVQQCVRRGRAVTFFHSFLGVTPPAGWAHPDPAMGFEEFCYRRLYQPTVLVGRGLNSGVRAVGLALALGFEEIVVVGNDCAARVDSPAMPDPCSEAFTAWLESLVLYADGRTASCYGLDGPIAEAEIDGHRWHTRPDMVISAMHLVELMAAYPGRIRLQGTSLPGVLAAQGPDFLAGMPQLGEDGRVLNFARPEALV